MHDLTLEVRETARQEAMKGVRAVNGAKSNPQNLYNMLVFFNPAVGSLPQHAHLFAGKTFVLCIKYIFIGPF